VRQADFEGRNEQRWRRFEAALRRIDGARTQGLPLGRRLPPDLADFPEQYRAVCHDLALATARAYGPRLLDRLNALALGGHRVLYTRRLDWLPGLLRFVARDFPARVRREAGPVLLAAALFGLPALAIFLTVTTRPDLVYSVFSFGQLAELEAMYDPAAEHIGAERGAASDLEMFGFYVWNNVGVAFQCFALGLFAGLGSAFALVLNGLVLGAAAAHMLRLGFGMTFFPFVIGHGAFELTAIVLSGAAGLRLGDALLAPGPRTRLDALRVAAGRAMTIVYGVIAMLLVAAALEAFWSAKAGVPATVKLGVGVALWTLVLGYLLLAGRRVARTGAPAAAEGARRDPAGDV